MSWPALQDDYTPRGELVSGAVGECVRTAAHADQTVHLSLPPCGLQVNADGASVYLVGDAGSTRGVILCYDIFGRGPEHGVPPIIVALAKHESSHYLLHCAATKTKCPAYT